MILWGFALFDFFIAAILLTGVYFDFLPWRIILFTAVAVIGKALVFNDHFLSYIDMLVAFYMIISIFTGGGLVALVASGYFVYKIIVSL